LVGSVASSTQDVGADVGHPEKPELQVKPHVLLAHVGCPFGTAGQT
jgi:hypothetical protein